MSRPTETTVPVNDGDRKSYHSETPQRNTATQSRSSVSLPGDSHEREADHVANEIMTMPAESSAPAKSPNQHSPYSSNIKSTPDNLPSKHGIPAAVKLALNSPGKMLDPATRHSFESWFGVALDKVRVHTDEQASRASRALNAEAFSIGNRIVFGRGRYTPENYNGRKLLAHEIAHVLSPSHTGLMRKVTPDYNKIKDALTYGLFDWAITDSNAHDVLVILVKLSAADLSDTVAKMESDGFLNRLLENISSADLVTYNTVIQSILQRIQRTGATSFAAKLGLSSQAAMAKTQATFMHAQNVATATVLLGPAPSVAQVSAQQATNVASTSIAPQTAILSVADENTQNIAATAAKTTFVTWVKAHHPELNITAKDIRVDARAVFNRGLSIIAFSDAGKAVVGLSFTRAVNANPAYALPTIVHELHGHEQYGPYGQAGSEYGLELYDQAAALMPGYKQPVGAGRTSEIDAYAYQETEIYSLMLEVPYFTPLTPAHSALASINYDPAPEISNRIGIIVTQFEARVAKSLIRGLLLRFRADPRLKAVSVTAFEQGIRKNFSATDATEILR